MDVLDEELLLFWKELNKKAVNRPKDQVDVIQLEKIKRLRENKG